ncbi:hypothetical protein LJCM5343_18050 [Lactobacillus paragasseri]|nr:hypothetical protein LpgJCM5343_06700 [Lactobacillus paragasseri]GBA88234.1 hypothetical protein LJCM5343_18050 [Lactobacillus paragasseri]
MQMAIRELRVMIMLQEIKILWQTAKLNLLHLILGNLLTAFGIILLVNDYFFYWPPEWQWLFNNDLVDAFAIMVGIGLIAFVFSGGKSQLANAVLLACSAFFLMMLTVLQLGHVLVMHDYSRLLSIVALIGWLLVIQYLAVFSKTVKRRK